jgi:hypothetical protein
LNRTLHESPAPTSLHSATPKEKTLLAFLVWRGWNFSKKERVFFFRGSARKDIRAVWRGEMRTRQSKTIFAGGKGFALPRLFFQNGWIWISATHSCVADSFLIFGRGGCEEKKFV